MRTYTAELKPHNSQKSYYGKAKYWGENGETFLRSYETVVCKLDTEGKFVKMWDGYSPTTMKHINSFRVLAGLETMNKKTWENLEVGVAV